MKSMFKLFLASLLVVAPLAKGMESVVTPVVEVVVPAVVETVVEAAPVVVSVVAEVAKEVAVPALLEAAKEIATPAVAEVVKEVAIPALLEAAKEVATPVVKETAKAVVNAGLMSSAWNGVKSFGLAVPGVFKSAGNKAVNAAVVSYGATKDAVCAVPGLCKTAGSKIAGAAVVSYDATKGAVCAVPGLFKTAGNKIAGAAVVSAGAVKQAGVATVTAAKNNPKTAIAIGVGATAVVGYGVYRYIVGRQARALKAALKTREVTVRRDAEDQVKCLVVLIKALGLDGGCYEFGATGFSAFFTAWYTLDQQGLSQETYNFLVAIKEQYSEALTAFNADSKHSREVFMQLKKALDSEYARLMRLLA